MNKFWNKIKNKKILIPVLVIVVIIIGYLIYSSNQGTEYEYTFAKVEKKDIKQTVSATGKVEANTMLDLNFSTTGQLEKLNVEVGDQVKKDDLLAELDQKNLISQLNQAQADLLQARSSLNKLLSGATQEELAVSEQEVDNAWISYQSAQTDHQNLLVSLEKELAKYQQAVDSAEDSRDDAQINLNNVIKDSETQLTSLKDSLATQLDNQLFTAQTALDEVYETLTDDDALNNLSKQNPQLLTDAWQNYYTIEPQYDTVASQVKIALAENNSQDLILSADLLLTHLDELAQLLSDTYQVLLNTSPGGDLSEAELDTLKSNIRTEQSSANTGITSLQSAKSSLVTQKSTYNTTIDQARSSLQTAENNFLLAEKDCQIAVASQQTQVDQSLARVETAKGAWQLAQERYNSTSAPAKQYDIDYYQAQILRAQARVGQIQTNIDKNQIYAPIDGLVAKVNYELGEQTSMTQPIIELQTSGQFIIKVDVPESDIAKIKNDQPAEITLDAYGNDIVFDGRVKLIEPAETVIQDVVYYRVTVSIKDKQDFPLKSGMSADLDILTAEKESVLTIPQRTIKFDENNSRYVEILQNNQEIKVPVTIGITADEGLVEVSQGLSAGQQVILFKREK